MHCLYVPCDGHEGGSASAAIDAIPNAVVSAHSRRSAIAGGAATATAAAAAIVAAAAAAAAWKRTDSSANATPNDVFDFCRSVLPRRCLPSL